MPMGLLVCTVSLTFAALAKMHSGNPSQVFLVSHFRGKPCTAGAGSPTEHRYIQLENKPEV